jgi:phosphonate transport system permease protein
MDNTILSMYQKRPKNGLRNLVISLILGALFLWSLDTLNFQGVSDQGAAIAQNILKSLFTPTLSLLTSFDVDSIWYLMFETLGIAVLGTLLGALLSLPFALFTARNILGDAASLLGSTLLTAIRTFPVFILGIMFVRVTGPGPFAGVLTIAVLSIGMTSKLFIEAIEDIDKGILEALDAQGATLLQKILYGIVPQLSASFISIVMHRFEINVKNATVLGLVGAGGIGFTLISAMTAFRWQDAASALWGIILIVLLVELLSNFIREKLVKGE